MVIRRWVGPDGVERDVGDKDDVGAMLKIAGKTYIGYVARRSPQGDPAPGPVDVDPVTRRDLFDLEAVRRWNERRPGQGDHGGRGAAKRWAGHHER